MTSETQKKIDELLDACREEIATCEKRLQELLVSRDAVLSQPESAKREALLIQIQKLIDDLLGRIRRRAEILLHAKKGTLPGFIKEAAKRGAHA